MQTLATFRHSANSITVSETVDATYARDCFDGSDREWSELMADSPTKFYIVACGLSGCYMADDVSVFTDKADALASAKETFERWQDEDSDAA